MADYRTDVGLGGWHEEQSRASDIVHDVGRRVDELIRDAAIRNQFLEGRARYVEAVVEWETHREEHKRACERAALRVVERGVMEEQINDDREHYHNDDREHYHEDERSRVGSVDVEGWFPSLVRRYFHGRSMGRLRWRPRHGATGARQVANAVFSILTDRRYRESGVSPNGIGENPFWGVAAVQCSVPPEPFRPGDPDWLGLAPKDRRLAFAYASLLAARDAVSHLPVDQKVEISFPRDLDELRPAVCHSALIPYTRHPTQGRLWDVEAASRLPELLRLIEGDLRSADLARAHSGDASKSASDPTVVLTDSQQAVWDALDGRVRNAGELAKAIYGDSTKEGVVRNLVKAMRARHVDIATQRGRGYYRPDAPPSGETSLEPAGV